MAGPNKSAFPKKKKKKKPSPHLVGKETPAQKKARLAREERDRARLAANERIEGLGGGSGRSRVGDVAAKRTKPNKNRGTEGTPGEAGAPPPATGVPGGSGGGTPIGDISESSFGYHFIESTEIPLNFGMGVVTPDAARSKISAHANAVETLKQRRREAREALEATEKGTPEYKAARAELRQATKLHQARKRGLYGTVEGDGTVNPGIAQGMDPYTTVGARYLEGDDTLILTELSVGAVEGLELADVQAQMVALGLMSEGRKKSDLGYVPGIADAKTTEAFAGVLADANARGISWQDLLFGPAAWDSLDASGDDSSSSSSGGGSGGGGGGGAIDFFDPEAARQAIDRSGVEQLGMNVDPEAREEIIAQLQAEAAAAEAAGQEYDLQAQINRKVKEKKPGDSALHNSFAIFDHFASVLGAGELFGGGGAGRPLTGPATGAGTGLR